MQIFFRGFKNNTISAQLRDGFTLNDFLLTTQQALGFASLQEARSFRYALCNKALDVERESAFETQKYRITQDCVIVIMVRLLGGYILSETLDSIAKQELFIEMEKVPTSIKTCTICLDDEAHCLRVCCTHMCKQDFAQWFIAKDFKVSCTICWSPIQPKNLFKTPEYIATLQALEDEKQLLQNIDCQRCGECQAMMVNESMTSQQVCPFCRRVFCFFCNRPWKALKMQDRKHSCGKECVYETMLSFHLTTFHYRDDMKIPSQRTCPKCLNLGAYDDKCKYHTCTVCKFSFCFLCLKEKQTCERHSAYDKRCVQTPVLQDYSMFPRLLA
ncbi:hypothetical protein BGZ70_001671 [Mortierella alpina]|uniref:RBR-type E3 ubiquitin transferase n=1 Tax=Mortierella alpina TaxID=64518 RepID=A0A9P6IVU9_MORAP|nr:hypothetical protein BGZ70_001671 [Mortierella alpina]